MRSRGSASGSSSGTVRSSPPPDAFGSYATCARLCFTAVPEGAVVRGIERLRAALGA